MTSMTCAKSDIGVSDASPRRHPLIKNDSTAFIPQGPRPIIVLLLIILALLALGAISAAIKVFLLS